MKKLFLFLLVSVFVVSFAGTSAATNGYFAHGYSIESKALGGAGVALPQGSLDASVNPALMAFVGRRLDISLSLFNPNREYTVTTLDPLSIVLPPGGFPLADGTVKSDSKFFLIPAIGANWMLNNNSSIGISIYGNGGMNTDYDTATFGGSASTGVDLMQLFVAPTYAIKVAGNHAFGISPIFAYQRFEARGLEAFGMMGFSSDSSNLSNEGYDNSYGYGARIGYYGELTHYLSVGASYQTRIWMSKYDKYAGLFAEQGDFDIPSNWTIGVAVKPIPSLVLLFDIQKIYYSEIDSVNNRLIPGVTLVPGSLGQDWGAGFGWDDMTIYKAGIQWKSSDDWTWRAGYSYSKQPIDSSEVLFNILAPGVIEQHATLGVTKALSKTQDLSMAVTRAFSKSVTGSNPLQPPGVQEIELKMNQWEFTVGYSWKF